MTDFAIFLRSGAAVMGVAGVLAGCSSTLQADAIGGDGEPVDEGGPAPIPGDNPQPSPTTGTCDKMDILFVIDNSRSMEEEQLNLSNNVAGFIEVLDTFRTEEGLPIDYRLGVVTTGVSKDWKVQPPIPGFPALPADGVVGEDGVMVKPSDCNMAKPWLARGDAEVSDAFACAALGSGIEGSGWEMPLEATHLALTARIADGTNQQFLRDDALLAAVVVTDEDDCSRMENDFTLQDGEELCDSPGPVTDYLAAFDDIKGGRGRWAAAIIAGLETGACEAAELGDAYQRADRLIDFADQAGANAITSSLCQSDLSVALADALATFDAACADFPPVE